MRPLAAKCRRKNGGSSEVLACAFWAKLSFIQIVLCYIINLKCIGDLN